MVAARITAVFLALICVEVCAQPTPQGSVTVQVTDRTGAVIPGASIEIDASSSKPKPFLKTDGQGQTVLNLPSGAHTLSITFPAFKRLTQQIEVQSGTNQMVAVKLDVATGGFVTVEAISDMPPPNSPETVFLPLQPLFNLDPLPSKRAKRRW